MAFRPHYGVDRIKKLCDSLGISGPVRRVVIDFDVRSAVMVYVQRFLEEPEMGAIEEALNVSPEEVRVKEVTTIHVDEKGNVAAA